MYFSSSLLMHQLSSALSGKGRGRRGQRLQKPGCRQEKGKPPSSPQDRGKPSPRCPPAPAPSCPAGHATSSLGSAGASGGDSSRAPPGVGTGPPQPTRWHGPRGALAHCTTAASRGKNQKDTKGISLEMCFWTAGTTNYTTRVTFLTSLRGQTFAGVVASCVKSAILFLLFK